MKTLLQSLRILAALTLLTGAAYPLVVTIVGDTLMPSQSEGSLVLKDGKIVGSALLAQKFVGPRYFHSRPSAADFTAVASGAGNQSPTSKVLADSVAERRAAFGANAPADLLTASGSGLDPHLSPEAAQLQAHRVAEARKVPLVSVHALIDRLTEPPQWGVLGEPRVNVLALNLALDAIR